MYAKKEKKEKNKIVPLQVNEMRLIEGGNRWKKIYIGTSMLIGPVAGAIVTLGIYNGYHDTK